MKTNQSLASIARQVLAICGVVFGVLTQSVTALHLPTAVSSILLVGGSVILAVEHYVADPSTGSGTPAVSGNAGPISGTSQVPGTTAAPVIAHGAPS